MLCFRIRKPKLEGRSGQARWAGLWYYSPSWMYVFMQANLGPYSIIHYCCWCIRLRRLLWGGGVVVQGSRRESRDTNEDRVFQRLAKAFGATNQQSASHPIHFRSRIRMRLVRGLFFALGLGRKLVMAGAVIKGGFNGLGCAGQCRQLLRLDMTNT